MLCHVLTLRVMAAIIIFCLQHYIPRFQHLQNLFIKIINENAYYSKIFDNPLLIFKTGSSFYKRLPVFQLLFNITKLCILSLWSFCLLEVAH